MNNQATVALAAAVLLAGVLGGGGRHAGAEHPRKNVERRE